MGNSNRNGAGRSRHACRQRDNFADRHSYFEPPGCSCPASSTYNISVTIPSLSLTQGTYWVTLAPDSPSSEPYLWWANGTNGTNAKIDGLSFVTGPYWPSGPQNVGNYLSQFGGPSQADWSMQLTASVGTPEPGSLALMSMGLGLCLLRLRPWKRRN